MSESIEVMRAIIHNRILLDVILAQLGMDEDKIDELNKTIEENMQKEFEKVIKNNGRKEKNTD